jgi:hypothetical protein
MAAERYFSPVIVTGDPDTHHFIALSDMDQPIETDRDGRIAVYTDRMRCHDAALKKLGGTGCVIVIGMAYANWKLFSAEQAHYLAD